MVLTACDREAKLYLVIGNAFGADIMVPYALYRCASYTETDTVDESSCKVETHPQPCYALRAPLRNWQKAQRKIQIDVSRDGESSWYKEVA